MVYAMRIERMSEASRYLAIVSPAVRPNGYRYGEERAYTVVTWRLSRRQVWADVVAYVRRCWPEDPRPIAGRSCLGQCLVPVGRVPGEEG